MGLLVLYGHRSSGDAALYRWCNVMIFIIVSCVICHRLSACSGRLVSPSKQCDELAIADERSSIFLKKITKFFRYGNYGYYL